METLFYIVLGLFFINVIIILSFPIVILISIFIRKIKKIWENDNEVLKDDNEAESVFTPRIFK